MMTPRCATASFFEHTHSDYQTPGTSPFLQIRCVSTACVEQEPKKEYAGISTTRRVAASAFLTVAILAQVVRGFTCFTARGCLSVSPLQDDGCVPCNFVRAATSATMAKKRKCVRAATGILASSTFFRPYCEFGARC